MVERATQLNKRSPQHPRPSFSLLLFPFFGGTAAFLLTVCAHLPSLLVTSPAKQSTSLSTVVPDRDQQGNNHRTQVRNGAWFCTLPGAQVLWELYSFLN